MSKSQKYNLRKKTQAEIDKEHYEAEQARYRYARYIYLNQDLRHEFLFFVLKRQNYSLSEKDLLPRLDQYVYGNGIVKLYSLLEDLAYSVFGSGSRQKRVELHEEFFQKNPEYIMIPNGEDPTQYVKKRYPTLYARSNELGFKMVCRRVENHEGAFYSEKEILELTKSFLEDRPAHKILSFLHSIPLFGRLFDQPLKDYRRRKLEKVVDREDLLVIGASQGHWDYVSFLLNNGVSESYPEVRTGKTALHFAVESGQNAIATRLIEQGVVKIDYPDGARKTALFYAVMKGNAELVTGLIQNGARVDILDKEGKNPLDYALELKPYNGDILKLLITKTVQLIDQNSPYLKLLLDSNGSVRIDLLQQLSQANYRIGTLLKYYPNPNDALLKLFNDMYANKFWMSNDANRSIRELIKLLLNTEGVISIADVDHRPNRNSDILYTAIRMDEVEIVELIFSKLDDVQKQKILARKFYFDDDEHPKSLEAVKLSYYQVAQKFECRSILQVFDSNFNKKLMNMKRDSNEPSSVLEAAPSAVNLEVSIPSIRTNLEINRY